MQSKLKRSEERGIKLAMSSMTLRTRITTVVALVLLTITGLLTAFSISQSRVYFAGEKMNAALVETVQAMAITVTANPIPLENITITTPAEQAVPMATIALTSAQRGFSVTQILALVVVDIVAIVLTYFLLGKALKPLSSLSSQISLIDEHRLNDTITVPQTHDEISRITTSFNSMLSRLHTSFAAQKAFAAGAAHELKTPLAIMKSSLQVVALDDSPTLEDYKEATAVCLEAADTLTNTINQLLETALRDTEECNRLQLDALFHQVSSLYEEELHANAISISYDFEPIELLASQTLVQCIFTNLLSNAIKYNKPEGAVTVSLKQQEGAVQFVISDTGTGIAPDHLPHIFEPFYRGGNAADRPDGNGLGLQIVKTAVDKLNGTIAVESQPDKGTTFTVTLPL